MPLRALPPQGSTSTSFATWAKQSALLCPQSFSESPMRVYEQAIGGNSKLMLRNNYIKSKNLLFLMPKLQRRQAEKKKILAELFCGRSSLFYFFDFCLCCVSNKIGRASCRERG